PVSPDPPATAPPPPVPAAPPATPPAAVPEPPATVAAAPFVPPAPPVLEGFVVRVLGPEEITGWEHPPERGLLRHLVHYLAANAARPVSVDKLRTALSTDSDADLSASTVRTNLSRLRSCVGAERLPEAGAAGYRLHGFTLDAAVFESLATRAATADPERAIELYAQALALIRGEPYDGYHDHAWVDLDNHRHHIEVATATAALRLGDLALPARADLALWGANQASLANPTDETLAALALSAGKATGRPGEVTRQWQIIVRRFKARQVEPSAQLAAHYRRLLED
ncbi:MAG: AfsR/SARP family transcriptional regulator, partial [Acidimicrobiales bacterium]